MPGNNEWKKNYIIIDGRDLPELGTTPSDSDLFLVIPYDVESLITDPKLLLLYIDVQDKVAWVPDGRKTPKHTHVLVNPHLDLPETLERLSNANKEKVGPITVSLQSFPETSNPLNNPINLKEYEIFYRALMNFLTPLAWKGK